MEGIDSNAVFTLAEGALTAIVHKPEEEPYLPKDAVKVKKQITLHNEVLCKAMEDFGGVIPLKFGTVIIGKNGKSASDNLKEWLKENNESLEKTWEMLKGKREYGIRIYYQKKRLESESEKTEELSAIRNDIRQKGTGEAYLMTKKLESRSAELLLAKVNQFTNVFYERLKSVTDNIVVNKSKLAINEEDDLLLNVSVLVDDEGVRLVTESLGVCAEKGFSYRIVGSFPPYSFAERGE